MRINEEMVRNGTRDEEQQKERRVRGGKESKNKNGRKRKSKSGNRKARIRSRIVKNKG